MAGGAAPAKSPDQLESELNRLQTEFDSLENQIRAASPRYAALTKTQPLTLAEVQQQVLDEGTALLEYSTGTDTSYLWAVTRGGVNLYKLPARAALEQQVAALRDHIIPQRLRRALASMTVEPPEVQRSINLIPRRPLNVVGESPRQRRRQGKAAREDAAATTPRQSPRRGSSADADLSGIAGERLRRRGERVLPNGGRARSVRGRRKAFVDCRRRRAQLPAVRGARHLRGGRRLRVAAVPH